MLDPAERSAHVRRLLRDLGLKAYQVSAHTGAHPDTLRRRLRRGLTKAEYIDLLAACAILGRGRKE